MIEFFLSKFWALLSAIAVLGVVTTSLNGTVQVATEQGRGEAFAALIEVIERPNDDDIGHIELPLLGILKEEERLVLGPDTIELVSREHHFTHTLPSSVKVMAFGRTEIMGKDGVVLGLGSILCIDFSQGPDGQIILVYPRTP